MSHFFPLCKRNYDLTGGGRLHEVSRSQLFSLCERNYDLNEGFEGGWSGIRGAPTITSTGDA